MAALDWSNMLSGLLGSIVGGVIGAGATVWATRRTIQATANQATSLQNERDILQQKLVARGLIAETAENLRSITATDVKGWEHKTQLVSTFWDVAKPNVFWMPNATQDLLREVYSGISKHNDIVLYDRHALDVGQGAVTQPVMELRKDISTRLQKLLSALQLLQ